MQKYTAEEVARTVAVLAARDMPGTARMLEAYAAELRAKEAEGARDIVNDPRPGDLLVINPTNIKVFVGQAGSVFDASAWKTHCDMNPRAVVVRGMLRGCEGLR